MALFRRRPRAESPQDEHRSVLPNGLFAPSNAWSRSTAGVSVTTQTALRDAAVWACQRVIVSTVAMLPVHAYREVGDRLQRLPADPPVVSAPSGRVSRRGWVSQMVRSGLQCGNMYAEVVDTDTMGRAKQIETIHPDSVTWQVRDGEETPYVNGKPATLWPLGPFLHVPVSQFLIAGSRVAMNPTEYGKTSVGTALAAEEFSAQFFGDGAHPTMIAKAKVPDLTAEQAAAIKESLVNATRGTRQPPVIGDDIDLQAWGTNPDDASLIDLLQFEVQQACRRYGVPPSMVYAAISGQNVTYSNVSQADLQFLKYSVQSWVSDLEDAWSDLAAQPHLVRFTTEAVLAMDAISRADLHEKRLRTKTRTVNEVRKIEDEEPFPDSAFDQPGIPGATTQEPAV